MSCCARTVQENTSQACHVLVKSWLKGLFPLGLLQITYLTLWNNYPCWKLVWRVLSSLCLTSQSLLWHVINYIQVDSLLFVQYLQRIYQHISWKNYVQLPEPNKLALVGSHGFLERDKKGCTSDKIKSWSKLNYPNLFKDLSPTWPRQYKMSNTITAGFYIRLLRLCCWCDGLYILLSGSWLANHQANGLSSPNTVSNVNITPVSKIGCSLFLSFLVWDKVL